MAKFLVHLTGGQSVVAYADDEGFEVGLELFTDNHQLGGTIEFENGTFRIDHIVGLEYLEE